MPDREGGAPTLLTHHRLLGARLHLQSRVRLAAAGAIVLGAVVARHGLGIEDLDVSALLWIALAVAVYNAASYAAMRGATGLEALPAAGARLRRVLHVVIVLDFLALTAVIWLVGGARSPFVAFYLLHVILSCILLTRREAVAIAGLAYALVVVLVLGEWLGILPPRLPGGAVPGTAALDGRYAITLLVVAGILGAVTVALLTSLTDRLRKGEETLRTENVELGHRSSLRRDFLHMALHDIQAPVGVATTNLRNMLAGIGGTLSEAHRASAERSLHRLEGTNQFLREFRMLEALETQPIEQLLRAVDARALLEKAAEAFREQAEIHRHTLELDLAPTLPPVRAIPELLREAVGNYLSNAIKYTPDGGRIVLRAFRRARHVCIEVEDNGVGITPADQERLFREFVRLDRAGTPVADVRGTGLGLSIVRSIIERQGGTTGVRSEPGVGSTFMLQLAAADSRGAAQGDEAALSPPPA